MQLKEKVTYIIGSIIVIYGAYAGKDLTDMTELIEGTVFLAFFPERIYHLLLHE